MTKNHLPSRSAFRTGAALALTAAVVAAPTAAADSASVKYSSKKTGVSTSVQAKLQLDSDKRVSQIFVVLSGGARIDPETGPACTAPRDERLQKGQKATCPANTRIGGGTATAVINGQEATAQLDSYNVDTADGNVFNIDESLNGNFFAYFTGRPSDHVIYFPFGSLGVKTIDLNFDRRSSGGKMLFRTPTLCRTGKWNTAIVVRFTDGTSERLRSSSPCTKR